VYSSERDTRGLHYPKALTQTLTGLYLSEICLVGLFGLKGAYGPVVMTFGLIIFTSLVHISLGDALSPLLYNLPRTLAAEEELRKLGNDPFLASTLTDIHDTEPPTEDTEVGEGYNSDFDPSDPTNIAVDHGEQNSRSIRDVVQIEGADKAFTLSTRTLSSFLKKKIDSTPILGLMKALDFWTPWITPNPNQDPNFILRFLHPEIFESYHVLRDMIPPELREMDPSASYADNETNVLKDAYSPRSIREKSPRLWIPRDPAGVSRQEVMHSGKVIEISDEGASIDEKGRLGIDLEGETERWVVREGEDGRVKF
jgi:calcium permeable stress-gated cation channel